MQSLWCFCCVNKQEQQWWGDGKYHLPFSLFWETQMKKTMRQARSPITGQRRSWKRLSEVLKPGLLSQPETTPAKQVTEVLSACDLRCMLYFVCSNGAGKVLSLNSSALLVSPSPLAETWAVICSWKEHRGLSWPWAQACARLPTSGARARGKETRNLL